MLINFVLFCLSILYTILVRYMLFFGVASLCMTIVVLFFSALPYRQLHWPHDGDDLCELSEICVKTLVQSSKDSLEWFMYLVDKCVRRIYYLFFYKWDVRPEDVQKAKERAKRRHQKLKDLKSGKVDSRYKQETLDTLKDPDKDGVELLIPSTFRSGKHLRRAHGAFLEAIACQQPDRSFCSVANTVKNVYGQELRVCVICHGAPAKNVYPNCGHLIVCDDCRSLAGNRCPYCRAVSPRGARPLLVA